MKQKKWFEHSYLTRFNNSKRNAGARHERVADWAKAKQTEVRGKGKCVVVPVSYTTEYRPAFAAWDESTAFKEKLLQYYSHPIFEALVIYTDEKGEVNAYMSQVAYDRYHIVNDHLNLDTFYGWFLKADWEDNVSHAAYYENGRQKLISKGVDSKGRISQNCGFYYTGVAHNIGYNVWSDGTFETVWLKEYIYICFEQGNGGAGDQYPYEVPAPEEGGGGEPLYVPVTTTYNVKNAICNAGSGDRWQMNDNLSKALDALGLFSGVADFSNSMIEALVRSVGGSGQSSKVIQTVVGRTVGSVTFVIGSYEAIMGIVDGDITESDMLNVLGAVAGTAALFAGGWVAVGLTTVSVGIAIYDLATNPPCP